MAVFGQQTAAGGCSGKMLVAMGHSIVFCASLANGTPQWQSFLLRLPIGIIPETNTCPKLSANTCRAVWRHASARSLCYPFCDQSTRTLLCDRRFKFVPIFESGHCVDNPFYTRWPVSFVCVSCLCVMCVSISLCVCVCVCVCARARVGACMSTTSHESAWHLPTPAMAGVRFRCDWGAVTGRIGGLKVYQVNKLPQSCPRAPTPACAHAPTGTTHLPLLVVFLVHPLSAPELGPAFEA